MPLKNPDPFKSRAAHLNERVNPFVALLRDGATSGELPLAFGESLADFPGRWRERIAAYYGLGAGVAEKPLVLEIGCHLGRTLLTMAEARPDVFFIGMDITYKRVVTTAQRAKRLGLKNVFCVMANATMIDRLFTKGELDGTLIFFPDPWVKKARQAKNRLVSDPFAQRLNTTLRSGGFCWLKTDQKLYFDSAAESLAAGGFAAPAAPATPALLGVDFTSTFEQRFQAQQLPTYGNTWVKRDDASASPASESAPAAMV